MLYCVNLDAFFLINVLDVRITGSSASEPVHDIGDVIDVKVEPVEVSYCVL